MITLGFGGGGFTGALIRSHAWAACSPPATAYRVKTGAAGSITLDSQLPKFQVDQHHGAEQDGLEPQDPAADHDDV